MSYIVAENLVKNYGNGDAVVSAIRGISFTIKPGEFVGVMGESGSGKSTLLSILGAMNAPTAGSLRVDDIDVYSLKSEQRADFRREYLGFVFQSFHLVSYLTAIENVMLPLTTIKAGSRHKKTMAQEALAWVGLSDKKNRLPNQLSGGEKERVAIARAIVNSPPILLADEPTGNLDTKSGDEIMQVLLNLNKELATTLIIVTHDPEVAEQTNRVVTIRDGVVVEDTK